jgi:hypothetical protein
MFRGHVMQKLLLILVIGILSFSFGACSSPEGTEETETIEETTPAETEGGAEQDDEGEADNEDDDEDDEDD